MYIMERKSGGSSTQKILQELKCKKKKFSLWILLCWPKGLGVEGKEGRLSIESLISAFALSRLHYLQPERVGKTFSIPGCWSSPLPVSPQQG